VLLVPYFQARFQNGGLGLVLAFGSTEIVMVMACVWLAPRGALALGAPVGLGRPLYAGAATVAVFLGASSVPPLLRLPPMICVFAFFSLANGLIRWGELTGELARMMRRAQDAYHRQSGAKPGRRERSR